MKIKKTDRFLWLMTSLLIIAFTVLAIFVVMEEIEKIDNAYENTILDTAYILATDDVVKEKLMNSDITLNDYVSKYYENVEELSLIIITDMDNIRYTHPDHELLLDECDQIEVSDVYNGEEYIGTYLDSSDDESIRAFVPIYDNEVQIGVASTGVYKSAINQVKIDNTITILIGFGFGLIASLVAISWLTNRFRNELLGFDPTEIALLYAENKSIVDQLNEAVISVNEKNIVTTLNPMAIKMLGIDESIVGKNAEEVFPFVDFKEIINKDLHILDKYRKINDEKLLMTVFPLYLENEIIGATAIFRSHLEVDSLVDQIVGYRQMSEALRSQKHEFQNKLHVVLGLIKMRDYDKAENYIMENVYTTNLASDYYTSRIKDDRILALFVGKEIQSSEYNAQLLLTSDSYLTRTHSPINSDDIVIVLGNLIDNAFEAYLNKDMEDKRVVVNLFEDDDKIVITVIDQAGGISPEVIDHMFERGVSTKNGESRGTGLSLVGEIVSVYDGEKHINSSKEETRIEIILQKVIS